MPKYISKINQGGNDILIKDSEARISIIDANGLAMVMSLAQNSSAGTITQTTNPEWKFVLTDYADKVLCGIKQDNKSYVYASIGEIIDCINSSWT